MLTITATDLHRFMNCNGSRLLEGYEPSSNAEDDKNRNEGNAADWLITQVHGKFHTAEELIDRKAPNGVYITPEMVDRVTPYLNDIGSGGSIQIETSFAGNNWQINSRADHIKLSGNILRVDDYKDGWRIVEPEMNWTLIAHAVGFMIYNPHAPIAEVHLGIHQPRPYHRSGSKRTWVISPTQLGDFYYQIDATLSNPSDLLKTGDQCYKCPKATNCPAFRKAIYNSIDTAEMAYNDNPDNGLLSNLLDQIKRAAKVLEQADKAYTELAESRMKSGQVINNYTLENEMTNKVWKSYVTPEIAQLMTGLKLTKPELMTPTQAKKAGGEELIVESMCERRNKGAKVVRMDANVKAKGLFSK